MAYLAKLVAAFFTTVVPLAYAGYAQVAPPVGFSGASSGSYFYRAAANELWTSSSTVLTNGALNVGGKSVLMPAAMRMAANAPRFAARAMFTNPLLLALSIAAPFALDWALSKSYSIQAGHWVKTRDAICTATSCILFTEFESQLNTGPYIDPYAKAIQWAMAKTDRGAFQSCVAHTEVGPGVSYCYWAGNGYGQISSQISYYYKTVSATSVIKDPATAQQFEDDLAAVPLPWQVPNEVSFDVPVEVPILNPSPAPDLQPQPLRVPQGEPQPVPNTNPQQWKTPVVDVVPAPTPSSPWQVDVQPKDVLKTDSSPLPQSAPVPATPASGTTTSPQTDSDLCALHPDIVACQKINFDTPTASDLVTRNPTVSVDPDSGWGASSASCPAPRYVHPQGRTIAIPFDLFCQYMSGIRPIIIALAWLGAGFILIGARGGD